MTTAFLPRPATPTDLEIVDDATRREFITGGAALTLLGIAGCGGTDAQLEKPAPSGRTVDHEFGSTTFTDPPRRAVSLDTQALTDHLVALGLTPVGSTQFDSSIQFPFSIVLEGKLDPARIADVGFNGDPNLEAIAALRPDLIVGYVYSFAEAAEQIQAIGPTIAFSDGTSWQEILDTLATVLDRRDLHDEWIARIDEGVERVRSVAAGRSVGVITANENGTFFISDENYDTSALLVRAGMTVQGADNPKEDFGNGVLILSGELLGEITADEIVVVTYEPDPAERENAFERNPLWAQLPAVRAGRVHVIDGSSWNNFGPIALVAMLDEAAELFARQ